MTTLLPLAALGLQTARRFAGVAVVGVALVISFVELSTHRVSHFRTLPVPPEYTALERKHAERDPRRVPARLLGHLPAVAADPRPAARQRCAGRVGRGPGAVHDPRPGAAGHGGDAGAARRDGDRDPSGRARRHAAPAARADRRARLSARRPLPGSIVGLGGDGTAGDRGRHPARRLCGAHASSPATSSAIRWSRPWH